MICHSYYAILNPVWFILLIGLSYTYYAFNEPADMSSESISKAILEHPNLNLSHMTCKSAPRF